MIELVNRSTRTMQKLIIDDGMKRVILKPGRLKIYRTVKLKQLIFGVLSLVAIVFTLVNAVSLHILPSVKKYLLPNPQIGYFSSIPIVSFETSMARLTVVDIATRDLNNRTTISRRLMNADREEITISVVALIQPNDMTSEKLDTSKLKVDTSKLSAAVRTLVSPPFASASLSLNTQSTSNVLIIGLGGSQMNNFLHHFFPHMNITVIELEQTMHDIALKYFGLSEDSNQRVIVMDGLEYLKEAADRGEKFDAVYIDACPTAFPSSEETLCPIHGFLDDVTIANLLAVLRGTGTLALKMLLITQDVDKAAERIAQRYRKQFAECIITPMLSEFNRVLVCSDDQKRNQRLDRINFNTKQNEFYKAFNLFGGTNEF